MLTQRFLDMSMLDTFTRDKLKLNAAILIFLL